MPKVFIGVTGGHQHSSFAVEQAAQQIERNHGWPAERVAIQTDEGSLTALLTDVSSSELQDLIGSSQVVPYEADDLRNAGIDCSYQWCA